jgi:2-polyprenyl-3-methyl-5-hydroxy-6-metoxy-1,4-benzoquinol methylase
VLSPAELSEQFVAWNRKWGAPYGRRIRPWRLVGRIRSRVVRIIGPFAFQGNSLTRTFEYPWVYYELPEKRGARLLEIGGALSGLQFVLSKEGADVHNVDPLRDYGSGEYASNLSLKHAEINKRYGTSVALHQSTLPACTDVGSDFDAIYSVSTIEHMTQDDISATLTRTRELLKPGGLLVLTVDLFINIAPFTVRQRNEYGSNVSIAWIHSHLPDFDLVSGRMSELYGYPQFSPEQVQQGLERFMMNGPQLAQAVTFRKRSP